MQLDPTNPAVAEVAVTLNSDSSLLESMMLDNVSNTSGQQDHTVENKCRILDDDGSDAASEDSSVSNDPSNTTAIPEEVTDPFAPTVTKAIRIGDVDEVNGEGSMECPGYVPTRHELKQLAKHWFEQYFNTLHNCNFYRESGSTESRVLGYSSWRLGRLASILGDEAVQKAVSKVKEEKRRQMGERDFDVYTTSDCEEMEFIYEDEGNESVAPYAVDYVATTAAKTLCDLPAGKIAEALFTAAMEITKGHVRAPFCEHDWQADREERPHRQLRYCGATMFQKCAKCGAIRERRVRELRKPGADAVT